MKSKIQIVSSSDVYSNDSELNNEDKLLLLHARKAVADAYAPYSNFQVGSAVLLENGEIIIGNNQENAAYPSGLCAERVAIYSAGARFPNVAVKAIAVSYKAPDASLTDPVTPCGACRQAIAEYENRHSKRIRLIMGGAEGKIYIAESIESLLPLMFNKKYLKK